SLLKLTERIAKKTLMSYFAYTRDLTICNDCLYTTGGMLKSCPKCKSENVDWLSRITGYYQRVSSWNKGKVQELKDRRRYTV
ncbi:TPA: anaerobic ribonucleoside-triphosphate reductase, partial [Candidatus Woesearchaeota archaeon]|nr:anaerobic ribonucleoside-triphosphate reductase [Candidatus Woesearchaeota archaeon]